MIKTRYVLILLTIYYTLFMGGMSSIHAWEFPYTATIKSDKTPIRSGPGNSYYATDQFKIGDTVEVYRHDADGWCAIRPPAGSFSWVPAQFLALTGTGLARITEDQVASQIGSNVVENRDQVRVFLRKNEMVEIMEHFSIPGANGPESWYKIAPPSGEFRWVHGSCLDPNHTGVEKESAALPVPDTPEPNTAIPAMEQEKPHEGKMQDVTAFTPPPEIETFSQKVQRLKIDYERTISDPDPSHWNTTHMLSRADLLLREARDVSEKRMVQDVKDDILKADALRRSKQADIPTVITHIRPNNTGIKTGPPITTSPGKYDYQGTLVRVEPRQPKDMLLPRYALVDDSGLLRCYVSPIENLDLKPYLNHPVSASGTRVYITQQRAWNLTVRIISRLDENEPIK